MTEASLFLNDLTGSERRALHNYKTASSTTCGKSHCLDLNAGLENALFPDEMASELRETAEQLDSVLVRCPPLSTDRVVFRGDGHRLKFRDVGTVGTTFRNLGFWSTSTSRTSTHSFLRSPSEDGHGVIFELQLPCGLRVYDMESLEGAGGAESELLLPRGILWTVKTINGLATDVDKLTASRFCSIFDIVLEGSLPPRPLR